MDQISETREDGMSLIVPFLNEQDNARVFCDTMDAYISECDFEVQLVFVDDGSTDATVDILKDYPFKNATRPVIVRLSKNYGSHAAIRAGIERAYYGICTWIGMDLQEPLDMLKLSWEKIKNEGYDAVYIEKKSVQVSPFSRFLSKRYHNMMRKYAVSNYSSNGVNNIVFNSKIKKYLNENIESNSSIILQIMDIGFNHCMISMDYSEREHGRSKWTFGKKVKLLIDSFVSFSFMPIRLVSIIGILMFMTGCIEGLIIIINWIVNSDVPAGYSTLICILSIGFGVTNISLGIIAEYLWRTLDAARKRPVFTVAEQIDITEVMNTTAD
ncbi:MAG: glycosyltransferase [Eubacterium sp.]|nr:glycosyltransferase [Eubacterium sp.]